MNKVEVISRYRKLIAFIPVFFISLLIISCDSDSQAQEFPECFSGTYLNSEGSGTMSIWSLTPGGSFTGISSTQEIFNFSTELGSWIATGADSAKAVFMDFSFGENGEFQNIARIDLDITFKGENCEETEGSFVLRFFEEGEDPLDISTDKGEPIADTFTGRKLIVE